MNLPGNPQDRQTLKLMLVEMTHCFSRIDSEREQLKEIKKEIKEKFGLGPKMANKVAKTLYLQDFEDQQSENEEFERIFVTLSNEKSNLQVVK